MLLSHFLVKAAEKPSCTAIADVGFILDSSGSLGNEYYKEKIFLKALAASFGISEKGSRASVIAFSYNTDLSIRFNEFTDIDSFNEAVDKIPLMGSTTRIDKALPKAENEMFSIVNGGRPGVPKLLVVLTDGSQTKDADYEDPGDIADGLRKRGINVISVGVGKDTDLTELSHIGGGALNAYTVDSFDQLIGQDFVNKMKEKSCRAGKCHTMKNHRDGNIFKHSLSL